MYFMFSWPRLPLNIKQEWIPCNKSNHFSLSASFSHIKSISNATRGTKRMGPFFSFLFSFQYLHFSIATFELLDFRVSSNDGRALCCGSSLLRPHPFPVCVCVKVLCAPPASSPSWAWACSSWEGCASPPVSFTGADTTSSWAQAFSSSPQVSVRAAFQWWSFPLFLCRGVVKKVGRRLLLSTGRPLIYMPMLPRGHPEQTSLCTADMTNSLLD